MAQTKSTDIKMTSSNQAYEKLKWIDEEASPLTTSRPPFEEVRQKRSSLLDKIFDNPLVPLGLVATTTCLALGLVNLKRGDGERQQLFMRGRVLFQGLTLMAMVVGVTLDRKRRKRAAILAEKDPRS